MILKQIKFDITDEELNDEKKSFDNIYEEYIKEQNNKSNYIYKNPIDKMRKVHKEKIIKPRGKREDIFYDRYAVNKKK
jgi:hypothetical protein